MAHPQRHPDIPYVGRETFLITTGTRGQMRAFEDIGFGRYSIDILLNVATKQHFSLPAYVYMPDHAHLVISGLAESADARVFVYEWKKLTGFAWKQRGHSRLWDAGYWDNHLRRGNPISSFIEYVVLNPMRAGLVESPLDYPLLGSTEYTGEELLGIAGLRSVARRQ